MEIKRGITKYDTVCGVIFPITTFDDGTVIIDYPNWYQPKQVTNGCLVNLSYNLKKDTTGEQR
jgi:hypothetical protein